MKNTDEQNEKSHITIGKASPEIVSTSQARLFVVSAIFIIAFCVLSFRVIAVSVFGDGEGASFAYLHEYGDPNIKKNRSDIVDRNGVLLAVNLATASLYANPQIIMDVNDAVNKLSGVFSDMDADTIRKRLQSDRSFVWVKRNLTPQEQYRVNSLGIPGLLFKEEEKRVYPHKELLSHTLGFVDIDGNGISGVEKQFDNYLKGFDKTGKIHEPLRLSIDVRAQSIVRDSLKDAFDEFKAIGASAVVMDVNNGEVLSMVSLPDFDLNNPSAGNNSERFNRSTLGVYEMGSTFKTFNMALGFELGDIGMKDIYDVSRPLKVANFRIRDYHQKKDRLTVPEIFMYSSNIGSAKIAMDIGAEAQKMFLGRLGLLDELEIELPEKSAPLFPTRWGKISSMTISYGHGIAVSPMHMAKATAALVNGGKLHPETLLYKGEDYVAKSQRVISQVSSDKIRKLMRFAVKHGTGSNADADGYFVGGKTGSADKADKGNYDRNSNISSFVAAFPMNKPKYVVLVMLDGPVGNASTGWYTTGGMVAAPIIKNIISRVAPVLGVMPVDENNYEIRKEFWYDYEREQEVAAAGAY